MKNKLIDLDSFQQAVDEKFKSPSIKEMETIYLCAMRYCLDRSTYMPELVIEILKKVKLSQEIKNIMINDIENGRNLKGDLFKEEWENFETYLKKQI